MHAHTYEVPARPSTSTSRRLEYARSRDAEVLARLGLTIEQLANRLEYVLGRALRVSALAARERFGRVARGASVVRLERHLEVATEPFDAAHACPFEGPGGAPCAGIEWAEYDFALTRIGSREVVVVTGIGPHLLRAHRSFEGEVPFRVDPEGLARVLEIEPGFRGAPNWVPERVWRPVSKLKGTPWEVREAIGRHATACRAGDYCVLDVQRPLRLPALYTIDGAELDVQRDLPVGLHAFRRVVHWYVGPRMRPVEP